MTLASVTPRSIDAAALSGHQFRYYDLVMVAFVVLLLLSQVVGAGKIAVLTLPWIGPWPFGAGILFFPVSYVLGDILTEVYGYARARRCIWAGFAGMIFLAFMSWVVVSLPPAPTWAGQSAYNQVFGQVPRIVFAAICAFWVGEFANSIVLARMKVWTTGRFLWARTIGSTLVAEGLDSFIFYPLAFFHADGWSTALLLKVLLTNWTLKVAWEVMLTPLTYWIVNELKRREGINVFDLKTDLSPFKAHI